MRSQWKGRKKKKKRKTEFFKISSNVYMIYYYFIIDIKKTIKMYRKITCEPIKIYFFRISKNIKDEDPFQKSY